MAIPAKLVALVVVLGVGYGLGSCGEQAETKTEVKVVEVPVVKTETVTKEVTLPYPESCTEALEASSRITANDGVQTAAVGEILLALQEMGTAAAFNDVQKVNELVSVVRKQGGILNTSMQERNTAITTFETYLAKCEAELEGGSN